MGVFLENNSNSRLLVSALGWGKAWEVISGLAVRANAYDLGVEPWPGNGIMLPGGRYKSDAQWSKGNIGSITGWSECTVYIDLDGAWIPLNMNLGALVTKTGYLWDTVEITQSQVDKAIARANKAKEDAERERKARQGAEERERRAKEAEERERKARQEAEEKERKAKEAEERERKARLDENQARNDSFNRRYTVLQKKFNDLEERHTALKQEADNLAKKLENNESLSISLQSLCQERYEAAQGAWISLQKSYDEDERTQLALEVAANCKILLEYDKQKIFNDKISKLHKQLKEFDSSSYEEYAKFIFNDNKGIIFKGPVPKEGFTINPQNQGNEDKRTQQQFQHASFHP